MGWQHWPLRRYLAGQVNITSHGAVVDLTRQRPQVVLNRQLAQQGGDVGLPTYRPKHIT